MSGRPTWKVLHAGALPPIDRTPVWVYCRERGPVVAYFDTEHTVGPIGPLYEATNGHALPLDLYTHWRELEDPGTPGGET